MPERSGIIDDDDVIQTVKQCLCINNGVGGTITEHCPARGKQKYEIALKNLTIEDLRDIALRLGVRAHKDA